MVHVINCGKWQEMDVHCSEVDSELPRFFHNEV